MTSYRKQILSYVLKFGLKSQELTLLNDVMSGFAGDDISVAEDSYAVVYVCRFHFVESHVNGREVGRNVVELQNNMTV